MKHCISLNYVLHTLLIAVALVFLAPSSRSDSFNFGTVPEEALPPTDSEAGRLLNEILAKPGQWNQMCSILPPPAPDRVPLFGYLRNPLNFITTENFERLRAQRKAVLTEIDCRLTETSASEAQKAAQYYAAHPETLQPLPRPVSFLDEYLVILLDLQGTEALPGLLRMEAALNDFAPYVKDAANWNAFLERSPEDKPSLEIVRYPEMHPKVLSVITALMLGEHHETFTKSKLYERYIADYAKVRTEGRFAAYRGEFPALEAPPERGSDLNALIRMRDRDWSRLGGLLSLPYDREYRDEIVAIAQRFLESVPPEAYAGQNAMASEPIRR